MDTAVIDFEQIGFKVVKNANFTFQVFSEKVLSPNKFSLTNLTSKTERT